MPLKQRIWLLPILAAALFGIGTVGVAWVSARTQATIDALGAADYPYLDQTTRLADGLDALVATVQSAVAEGDKDRLSEVADRSRSMKRTLASLKDVEGKADAASELDHQFDAYAAATLEAAAVLLKAKEGDADNAVKAMQSTHRVFEAAVKSAQEKARADMDGGIARSKTGVRQALATMLGSALLVLIGLGAASAWLIRSIWREIGGEPAYARHVIGRMAQGDLSMTVKVQGDDSSLLGALRTMHRGLSGIVGAVRSGTESITVASLEIAQGSADLSQRTEHAASNLQVTAGAVTELAGSASQSAESARQARHLAHTAAEVAQRGGAVVTQVVSTMDEIQASSRRIAEIIGVIDAIAFQTNILALNAAAEAGRAGAQGRGFAVVAGEVRSLAQRSADAAKEIKTLIGASVERIDAGSRLVADAGATMNEIVTSVRRVTDIIGEISAAATEQSTGITQVESTVSQLDHMTQQNAALVEQSTAAAESLRDQVERLTGVLATFKLDGVPRDVAPFGGHAG
jgi:methyl-accepting chemotaxis protein